MPKKQKNEEKKNKKSVPPFQTAGTKFFFLKNVQSRQPVTLGHVSSKGSFPPFENIFGNRVRKKIHI